VSDPKSPIRRELQVTLQALTSSVSGSLNRDFGFGGCMVGFRQFNRVKNKTERTQYRRREA